jgi:hypothetical protein
MSTRLGIDYAWGGPPSIAALKRAGVAFVGRYFSLDPSKSIHHAEYKLLDRHGIEVKVAWETTAERALDGRVAGRSDALQAEAQRELCGMPADQVIYFAVDFDADGPEVEAYFAGACSAIGVARVGVYGGYKVVKYLFEKDLVSASWQTYAWSDGKWHPRARVRQYSNGHQLGGVEVDYDVELVSVPPVPPANGYVPGDEHNWLVEYDRLTHEKRAPWRRRQLRFWMHRRMRLLRKLAKKKGGWDILNRAARYHELLRRTT